MMKIHQPSEVERIEIQPAALLSALQDAEREVRDSLHRSYYQLLSPAESEVQSFVDAQKLSPGAWYRPIHNIVVPLAMRAIIRDEGLSEDLMFAAQLHDAGYEQIELPSTLAGLAWEGCDVRREHMCIGEQIVIEQLGRMAERGVLEISKERIRELGEIVAKHDNPYIGIPLQGSEELAHRDADRAFVMSTVSFWKDFIALSAVRDKEFTPAQLLMQRMAFFYSSEAELPHNWDLKKLPLKPGLAAHNEGGRVEPPNTRAGKEIIDAMFLARAAEIDDLADIDSAIKFKNAMRCSLAEEMSRLLQPPGPKLRIFG